MSAIIIIHRLSRDPLVRFYIALFIEGEVKERLVGVAASRDGELYPRLMGGIRFRHTSTINHRRTDLGYSSRGTIRAI